MTIHLLEAPSRAALSLHAVGRSARVITDDPQGSAMTRAQDGDAHAYRSLLRWCERWLRTYYEYHEPDFDRHKIEQAVGEALWAVHAKRHTFAASSPFPHWLEAIAAYKTPHAG